MAPAPSTMDVLCRRDVRLLLGGQAVSVFGDRMVAVALAFAVLEIGGSTSSVGLVLACGTLPLVACLPLGGVVADRTSRRAVMVGADVVRLVSQGAAAALLLTGTAEVWSLAACAAVTGGATGFFNPASTGLLPVWGPVAAVTGITTALWLAFAVLLVAALAPLALRDVRGLSAGTTPR